MNPALSDFKVLFQFALAGASRLPESLLKA
jgi:hypothetical protein